MKKIAFIISIFAVIIYGCADEEKPAAENNNTNNTELDLSKISADDGYRQTARLLYGEDLTDAEYNNIHTFFKGIETGSIFNNGKGAGEVENGIAAAAVLISVYYYALDEYESDISGTSPMSQLLYRTTFSDSTKFNKLIQDTASYDNTALISMLSPVVQSQQLLQKTVSVFIPQLLDTSSSASQGSNTNVDITYNDFNIIINAAYTFAYPLFNLSAINISDSDKIASLLSISLYNLSTNSKFKIIYNQSIKYFRDYFLPKAADAAQLALYSTVVQDAVKNNGKIGGAPYKGDVDDAIYITNPYSESSTDYYLYPVIAKTLYGAPFDEYYSTEDKDTFILLANNPASNQAVNNMLTFYKSLKSLGLKVPEISTSLIGYKVLSETAAVHLKDNLIIYSDFNTSPAVFESSVMSKIVPSVITETSPVCMLIKEFNKEVENAALSNETDKWIFDSSFSSNNNPCNITIE